jgi:hypothetical protein
MHLQIALAVFSSLRWFPDACLFALQCAHMMAMAVQRIFKDAQVTIGPWIERGFYYDFDLKQPLTDKAGAVVAAGLSQHHSSMRLHHKTICCRAIQGQGLLRGQGLQQKPQHAAPDKAHRCLQANRLIGKLSVCGGGGWGEGEQEGRYPLGSCSCLGCKAHLKLLRAMHAAKGCGHNSFTCHSV